MACFPAFFKIEGCPFLVVGGGRIALQKIKVLKDFKADITVVSPEFTEEIWQMEDVYLLQKEFGIEDLENKKFVIAATADVALNHEISRLCRQRRILVNAVDQIEDCDFFFPSYIKQGDVVAAFSSSGKSPVMTQYLKKKMEPFMNPKIGVLAESLGSLRKMIKESIQTESNRKLFYQELLSIGLEKEGEISEEDIASVLGKYR